MLSHYYQNNHIKMGQQSSVSRANRYRLGNPRIKSRCWWEFPHLSRPALGPIQPPVKGYRFLSLW